MKHLTEEQISRRLDGALEGKSLAEVERHLSECDACRQVLSDLAAQERALEPALTHDPGNAYFETFPARVEDRIRAAGLGGAQARLGGSRAASWWSSPRRLAWVGGVAAVAAGAALVLVTSRETPTPTLRDDSIESRLEQREEATPRPEAVGRPAEPQPESFEDKGGSLGAKAPEEPAGRKTEEVQAPAAGMKVAPSRSRDQRANERGEAAPVPGSRDLAVKSQPASPAPAAGEGRGVRVGKRPAAFPMKERTSDESTTRLDAVAPQEVGALQQGETLSKLQGDEIQLCGEVVDPAGRPVVGAQVALADRGRTATTDARGRFCVGATEGLHELTVLAVGFEQVRQQVRVGGESAEVRIAARPVPVLEPPLTDSRTVQRDQGSATFLVGGEDRFRALPDSVRVVVTRAQQLQARAASRRSASGYDAAAAEWQRALSRMKDEPSEIEARFRLAEARFRAWEASPSSKRARAAVETLTSYLVRAPAGTRRNEAAVWLDRVKR